MIGKLKNQFDMLLNSFLGYFDLTASQASPPPKILESKPPLKSIFSTFQMILSKKRNIFGTKKILDFFQTV